MHAMLGCDLLHGGGGDVQQVAKWGACVVQCLLLVSPSKAEISKLVPAHPGTLAAAACLISNSIFKGHVRQGLHLHTL
jgi:hypothetical protein